MKGIETGKDKVRKISDALRKETLEPAMRQRDEIIERAHGEAARIIEEARLNADKMMQDAENQIARERNIFNSSIVQASKQAIQILKQNIEDKLFNKELGRLLSEHMKGPKVLADLITAVVKAIEKEGLDADLSVFIPASVPAREVNVLLAKEILEKLKEKSVLLTPIGGGIEVKMRKENITLDLSDTAIKELVSGYIRKDFRDLFLGE